MHRNSQIVLAYTFWNWIYWYISQTQLWIFHAHFLDFHGHIFFNFSRAQNLVSRTQTHENFHGHLFFSRALFMIFFPGGTPILTGKKNTDQSHEWQQVKILKSFFLDFLFLGVTLDLIIGEKNTKKCHKTILANW